MTITARIVSEVAAEMSLAPLAVLAWLRVGGQHRDVAWWWLAAAFAVSWLADTAALWLDPWLVSAVYPVTQAGLIGFVFLTRRDRLYFVGALLAVGTIATVWQKSHGPDVFLRTVAWGAVAGIVADRWALGRLRAALLVSFGLGLVCWWGYALWPGWTSWGAYQLVRLAGIILLCGAALRPFPSLKVTR